MKRCWIVCAVGLLAIGCGGKVVVDGGGAGGDGQGGEGPGPGPGGPGSSSSGGCFFVPQPVGGISTDDCGGTGSGGGECTTTCFDQDNHIYDVTCTGSSCRCSYDGETKCTCVVDVGDACDNPCCPAPWISF